MSEITIEFGGEVRCQCNECDQEWEICLEPKFAEMDPEQARKQGAGQTRVVQFCPLCGSTNIEEV